tara:strand:- start:3821 stop:5593 length:1773 start_codon:yes stop_codon:yes gene_type:complete
MNFQNPTGLYKSCEKENTDNLDDDYHDNNEHNNETYDNEDHYGFYNDDGYESEIDPQYYNPNSDQETENCEFGYISSDDELINIDTLSNIIDCIRKNPIDCDLIYDLVGHLERFEHYHLAYQIAQIGLETSPTHEDLESSLTRLPSNSNITLQNKIKNIWLLPQKYIHDDHIQTRFIENNTLVETLNKNESPELDLDGIVAKPNYIPSIPDSMIMISHKQQYSVFRKFYIEPYNMYNLQLKLAISKDIEVFLYISTELGVQRLQYKLSGSVIQYNFNSLNQNIIQIGLKGKNNTNQNTQNGIGQIRIIELSLTKLEPINISTKSINTIRNNLIKNLTPTIPIIANLVINDKDSIKSIQTTIESVIDNIDTINIYIPEKSNQFLIELQKFCNNTKFNLQRYKKHHYPDSNLIAISQSEKLIGYHFIIGAGIKYHKDYIPLIISKLQQFNNRAVISLRGIQLNPNNYKSWNESKTTILPIMTPQQDLKIHIGGLYTCSFMSGTIASTREIIKLQSDLTKHNFENHDKLKDQNKDLTHLWISVMAQISEVPMICPERVDKMIKYDGISPDKIQDHIGQRGETIIKNITEWKFY